MTWFSLTLNEWRRRPGRTTLTTVGVAIAIAALFSLLCFQRGYQEGVELELEHLGAHVLVVPKGCPYDAASIALHGAKWPCYLKERYLAEVRATPGIKAAAPALMWAFYDDAGRQIVYVGIDTNMQALKRGWQIDGTFPSREGELLAGYDVAQRCQWKLGQQVRLAGIDRATATVRGILARTHGPDDSFTFLRLADAQAWLHHPAELTHILVRLKDPAELESVVRQLRGCDAGLYMNVVPLAHLFRTIQAIVSSTRTWLGCIALIALLAAGAGVSNTVLMAVAERTREIGVLRAVGASRRQVFQLFWLQTLQICLLGAVVGILTAFLASWTLETWLRSKLPFAPTETLLRWEWRLVLFSVFCALGLGSLAGFFPAWRATLLSPTEAMRARGSGL